MIRRTSNSALALLLLLGLVGSTPAQKARAEAKVEPLVPSVEIERARFEDGRVVVDFRVHDALTEDTLESIHSGIPVKFRHRVEVFAKRKFLLSPRNVIARSVVVTRVAYDALTGRYELSRVTSLKKPNRKKGPPPQAEGTVTTDRDEMLRWMTATAGVVLFDPKRELPSKDLRVSVESSIGRRYVMWVIPASETVAAVAAVER